MFDIKTYNQEILTKKYKDIEIGDDGYFWALDGLTFNPDDPKSAPLDPDDLGIWYEGSMEHFDPYYFIEIAFAKSKFDLNFKPGENFSKDSGYIEMVNPHFDK